MIQLRLRRLFNVELALILGVGIASIPTVLPKAQADSVVGGGKCVVSMTSFQCRFLANNASTCPGSYISATEGSGDGMSKDMKTDKWCSGCDSEVTQFDLKTGCVGTQKLPVPAPIEVP